MVKPQLFFEKRTNDEEVDLEVGLVDGEVAPQVEEVGLAVEEVEEEDPVLVFLPAKAHHMVLRANTDLDDARSLYPKIILPALAPSP